ncbi:MAG TPA: nuclear transport factor 2 family protein [Syntrophales bacterium]|nr:nuclear transport factor 2 family protein [Syntrophales bacterium]
MTAELEQLNQDWTKAWLERDAATVDRLMAPEYVYVTPSGQVIDRQTILGIIRSPEYRLASGTRSEVWVMPLGEDTAAVMSRWQGEGSYQGHPFQDDHRCTSVFVHREVGWQLALEHCSAVSEPAIGWRLASRALFDHL